MNALPDHLLANYVLADQERMAAAKNYFAWQARMVLPELGQRVVEVGCGIGNFTRLLLDREMAIGVDIEPACIARLKERFPAAPNLRAFACAAGSAEFRDLAKFNPDSCVCLNVLEHIDRDGEALHAMASILKPAGKIVLLIPAFQALYGPIDRNLGHRRRYTRASILELASTVGLEVRKTRYVNFVGFFGWWINAHILRREAQSPAQIEFFDRRVVPLISRVESRIAPPFGQSLFAVLQKISR